MCLSYYANQVKIMSLKSSTYLEYYTFLFFLFFTSAYISESLIYLHTN